MFNRGQQDIGEEELGADLAFTDAPWKDQLESWLIPVIAGNHRLSFVLSEPPAGTSDEDVAYVAGLIFRYLRSQRGVDATDENLLKLLFRLPRTFEIDPLALTAAVLFDPGLLSQIPELSNREIYGPYVKFLWGVLPDADEAGTSAEAAVAGQALIREFVNGRDSPLFWLPDDGADYSPG
jgi:hypothetical protein